MLKRLFAVITFVSLSATADPIRLSEPVHVDAKNETFGAVFDDSQTVLSLSEVMAAPEQAKPFLMRTEVASVCQKKGCFFIAREGSLAVRIAFKDYGFFIPTDSSGKTVLLQGELIAKNRTEEQAAHFSKDLGADASVEAGKTFEIVASGIRIPKSEY